MQSAELSLRQMPNASVSTSLEIVHIGARSPRHTCIDESQQTQAHEKLLSKPHNLPGEGVEQPAKVANSAPRERLHPRVRRIGRPQRKLLSTLETENALSEVAETLVFHPDGALAIALEIPANSDPEASIEILNFDLNALSTTMRLAEHRHKSAQHQSKPATLEADSHQDTDEGETRDAPRETAPWTVPRAAANRAAPRAAAAPTARTAELHAALEHQPAAEAARLHEAEREQAPDAEAARHAREARWAAAAEPQVREG